MKWESFTRGIKVREMDGWIEREDSSRKQCYDCALSFSCFVFLSMFRIGPFVRSFVRLLLAALKLSAVYCRKARSLSLSLSLFQLAERVRVGLFTCSNTANLRWRSSARQYMLWPANDSNSSSDSGGNRQTAQRLAASESCSLTHEQAQVS